MIKVIRRGSDPDDQLFAGTCGRCGTKVECERRDGTYVPPDHVDEKLGRVAIDCPHCGTAMSAWPKRAQPMRKICR